ncbi:gamma-glutamylcyclotransferase [Mesobacterium pallidum]|uniref:gamma-glutamylcyclotransferase n=1 Tax=Mesobacterium pallidum TaxID=2872037 RepID=UPI001EE15C1C|nr:gamma-glutamylcyclotransferase [Mesobacterium pallidum]
MPLDPTAFRHHPNLAPLVEDPETSFFRDLDLKEMDRMLAEAGMPEDWRLPDDEREVTRQAALAGRLDQPLWIFAYGSLMWNPGILFDEVRRARIEGHARRFCLVDEGGRGTVEAPGLQAALDAGPACDGLVMRIPAGIVDRETEFLWRREMIAEGYNAAFVTAETAQGPVEALTFVADHGSDSIQHLAHAEQVRIIATARGFLGSNRDYLANVVAHFEAMRIDDPEIARLWRDVQAFAG